jgi:hypothetical protein
MRYKEDNIVYVPKYIRNTDAEQSVNKEEQSKKLSEYIGKLEEYLKEDPKGDKLQDVFNKICAQVEASSGIVYRVVKEQEIEKIVYIAGYAFYAPASKPLSYEFGEGLAGQVAKSKAETYISHVPESYISVVSGLGQATPKSLAIFPIQDEETFRGVVEIGFFKPLAETEKEYLREAVKYLIKYM